MNKKNEDAIRYLYHVAEAATEDLDAFVNCYAEDGRFVDMSSGFSLQGRKELWRTVATFSKAFPDMHREIHSLDAAGDSVFVELTLHGTHQGPLELPIGTLQPTGKTMKTACCDVFRLKDGKVTQFNCYVESSMMFAQLGVLSNLQAALNGG